MKEIYLFICEDEEASQEIIQKYMVVGKVTYAEVMPAENRKKIVDFLEVNEEPFLKL